MFLVLVGLVSFVVWLFLRLQGTAETVATVGSQLTAAQKATGARLDTVDAAQKTTGARLDTVNATLFQTGARVDSVSSNLSDLDARALGVAQGTAIGVAQVPKQVDGKVADLQSEVSSNLAAGSNDFNQKLLAQAADVDRQIKTQVATDALRIAGNWMFVPGSSNDLFLTDDRRKGLGNLVVDDSKATRVSAGTASVGELTVAKHAAFQGDVTASKGLRFGGKTGLKRGGNELRVELDGKDKGFAVYAGSRQPVHSFDDRGDARHAGTLRAGKTASDRLPRDWTSGVHAKGVFADAVSVGSNGDAAAALTAERGGDGKLGAAQNLLLGAGGNVVVQSKLFCMGAACLSADQFAKLATQANPAVPAGSAAAPAAPAAPVGA